MRYSEVVAEIAAVAAQLVAENPECGPEDCAQHDIAMSYALLYPEHAWKLERDFS